MSPNSHAVEIDNLVKTFGAFVAVDHVSLQIPKGEIFGFLGPNGAGKSTTIRILTGFLPATSGRAEVAGHDVATDSLAVRRCIGYLPENVPLPTDARVAEYLEFRARLKGIAAGERPAALERALQRCGLLDMRRRIVGQLSRGYRQRVGLADALLADPPVLILDEPTAGLDPAQIRETRKLMRELGQEHTMLLSTHILSEVEATCDSVIVIYQGEVVVDGSLASVRQRYRNKSLEDIFVKLTGQEGI